MPRLFPKARDDGSFRVRLHFAGPPHRGISPVQSWISQWVAANSVLGFFGESLRFFDFFRAEPVAILGKAGELCIILTGNSPDQRHWKEWYVRLVRDLLVTFPEVGELSGIFDEP